MASNYDPENRRFNDIVFPLRTPEDDELSIIDVNAFDDTADEKWLYSTGSRSRRNSVEMKIEDLDAWLHSDVPEFEAPQSDSSSRRSIDTRTFTRIKRRSNNRLSLENIDATFSAESMPYPSTNVWKTQPILESPLQENNNTTQKERKDSIPMMLRPKTNQMLSTFLSETPSSIHSQASMEAFLNLAKSKEGMSLLSEMSDPDVSSFLMNVSQPSLLYSSIMSDGRNDENVQSAIAGGDSLVDSQILTDSMMEASMFKEVQDTTLLAEFLKQSNDNTMLVDRTFCKDSDTFDHNEKTFVNELSSDNLTCGYSEAMDLKSSDQTFTSNENSKSNDTFTSFPSPISVDEANSIKILSPHENLLNSTRTISAPNSLNSTRTISLDHLSQSKADNLSTTQIINSENKTDLTFDLKPSPSLGGRRLDVTFDTYKSPAKNIPRVRGSTENTKSALDSTYDAIPNLRAELLQEIRRSTGNKFDSTFTADPLPTVEPALDTTYNCPNPAGSSSGAEPLNETYVQVPSAQQPEYQNVKRNLDVTYDAPPQMISRPNSTQNMQRMSYANKNPVESQALGQNRFNTYKKNNKLGSRLSKAAQITENHVNKIATVPLQPHVVNAKINNNLNSQRFNTYKKSSNVKNNNVNDNNLNENKLGSTFVKPSEKIQSKLQAPRQLSRLPQLFQKSNPNLGSDLRPPGKFGSEIGLATGFGKGSQTNIANNITTLSRYKSEGRLLQSKHYSELVKGDSTSRSMESIDSTGSAHSAPLEDRMNFCPDSGRAPYAIKPKNLQALKKLGSIEGNGKFGGSTPKVRGPPVLQNTWVQEKDLPSPILKNGNARSYAESTDSRSTSPSDSAEFAAKTSSPITISPASSDQAINVTEDDNVDIEEKKENIQAADNVQPKQMKAPAAIPLTNATKLRRPTNWTGGPKVANGVASGIPRPSSRIPAPKFVRPSLK